MPLTLSEVQAQIAALREAINSGQRRISYSDKTVEYRSLDEMWAILRSLENEESTLSGTVRTHQVRMVTSDGDRSA